VFLEERFFEGFLEVPFLDEGFLEVAFFDERFPEVGFFFDPLPFFFWEAGMCAPITLSFVNSHFA